MNTQRFRRTPDGHEMFAELTWTRRALEICRGRAGTAGDIVDEIFSTEAEVARAVARAAATLVAEGFVEDHGPPLRVAPDVALAAAVCATHLRRCALPICSEEPADVRSRLGGLPTAAGPWPRCGYCDQPLSFLLELSIAEIPLSVLVETEGLLQIFLCADCRLEGGADDTEPFHPAQLVRVVPSGGEVASIPDTCAEDPDWVLAPEWITGWQLADHAPFPETIAELFEVELGDAVDAWNSLDRSLTHHDKLGGWPAWGQELRHDQCRTCSTPMEFVLQLDGS